MKRTSPSFVWCCQPKSNNFNNILFMNFYFSMLKWISYGTAEYFPVFNDITFLDFPLIYHKYAFSNTCVNQQQKKWGNVPPLVQLPKREDVIHVLYLHCLLIFFSLLFFFFFEKEGFFKNAYDLIWTYFIVRKQKGIGHKFLKLRMPSPMHMNERSA